MMPLAPRTPVYCVRILLIAEESPRRAVMLARRAVLHAPESAWAQFTLGWSLMLWERFAEAGQLLLRAQTSFDDQQDPRSVAHCRLGLLLIDVLLSLRRGIDRDLADLAETFTALGDLLMAARTQLELARYLNALGRPAECAALLHRIDPLLFGEGTLDAGRMLRIQTIVAYQQGDFARATSLLDQAEQIFIARRSRIHLARCWIERASIAGYQEDLSTSLAFFARAEALFRRADMPMQLAFCNKGIGLIATRQGRYDEALRRTLWARATFVQIGRSRDTATCTMHLGNIYLHTGRWNAALVAYSLAEEQFNALGVMSHSIWARRNRAMVYRAQGLFEKAWELLARVEVDAERSGNHADLAEIWSVQAALLADRGQASASITRYDRAYARFAQRGNQAAAAECQLERGWLLLREADAPGAEAQFFAAAPALLNHPHHAWRVTYGLGRCAELRGDLPAAWNHLQQACAIVAGLRRRIANEQMSSGLYGQATDLYADALRLAAARGDAVTKLIITEGQRALTLQRLIAAPVHRLSGSEDQRQRISALLEAGPEAFADLDLALEAYSEQSLYAYHLAEPCDYAALLPDDSFNLDALRAALNLAFADDWSAITYSLAGTTLRIICVTPEVVWVETTALDPVLERLIAQVSLSSYRSYIYNDVPLIQGLTKRPWERIELLTKRLLPEGIRARLHPDHRLLLVPAGPLHALPWAALRLGEYWLAELAVIHTLPALAIVPILTERRATGTTALMVGCSDFQGRARALPSVPSELESLAALWPGPVCSMLNQAATRDGLIAACEAARDQLAVLHMASHARLLPAHGLAAHIKLWDADLLLTEIIGMDLAGAMVVLSVCEGAAADVLAGEEVLSLSWGFLAAGASGVMASVWPMPDQALHVLMEAVYRRLTVGVDPALALALAQRELIRHAATAIRFSNDLQAASVLPHAELVARGAADVVSTPQIWGALQVMGSLRSSH